ncbi:cohesin domain-containing protein [Paenibacillus koleovorans]|uniref:cohesin domain-containing protein n=1 Tax=Paenibacillus koleovorans TaxID=121608 RepID=UPI000FD75B6C|nr:cohesin domain-containing protein [Paenibacillus koleovorans]
MFANGYKPISGAKLKLLVGILFGLMAFFVASSAYALPVFPGAAGYGTDTPAGRGGKVYKVTSLEDRNVPGTLRYAISQSGPRVVVFEVSGTITINNYLDILDPYITIAGQTAPSPGIFLKGANMRIMTHDVLIQHIRIAPGDEGYSIAPTNRDAVAVSDPNGFPDNVVIDHSTFTWTVDEVFSTYGNYGNVTFSNLIASEPLHDSIHVDEGTTTPGPHGFGPLFDNTANSKVTMSGSLVSHAEGRMPYAMSSEYVQVNNVFYDRINSFNRLSQQRGIPTKNSIVGNVFKEGPSLASWASSKVLEINANFVANSQVHMADNLALNPKVPFTSQWDMINNKSTFTQQQLEAATPPVWNAGLIAKPSNEVFNWVMSNAGARPADRLPYETRIVNQAINGTGTIMDSISEAGGWPVVAENQRKLVIPKNPSADSDGDGYTNLEEWLQSYAAFVEGRGPQPPLIAPEDGEPEDNIGGNSYPIVVSNLSILSDVQQGDPWAIMNNVNQGDLVYGDRAFKFESVSSVVYGSNYIMTNANSKNYQGASIVATFKVDTTSDVFLAFDDRMNPRPDWLAANGWVDTGEEVVITGNLPFSLYKKRFQAGETVTLWKSANKTNLFFVPFIKPIPAASLSGDTFVYAGRDVQVGLKLRNVTDSVYAQDITIQYDASLFELISTVPSSSSTVIASVYGDTPGQVRILTMTADGIDKSSNLLDLTLRAKSATATGTIQVIAATLGAADGRVLQVLPGTLNVRVYNTDLNGNNITNVGDLALFVPFYRQDQNSPDWNEAQKADFNGDGIVDVLDLALLAEKILN